MGIGAVVVIIGSNGVGVVVMVIGSTIVGIGIRSVIEINGIGEVIVSETLDDFGGGMVMVPNGIKANPKNVVSIILGGGSGVQLFPLTKRAATPAVPVGGCYRLIDIPMSNCINSGINKVFVLTQFNSASLNRHISRTYFGNGINFGDGYVEFFAYVSLNSCVFRLLHDRSFHNYIANIHILFSEIQSSINTYMAYRIVVTILVLLATICDAQLSSTFYDTTCPDALTTIRTAIRTAVSKERRMAASLIRLHFHDCFVQGCDASILLDDSTTIESEKTALPNLNSARGFQVIDNAKSQVEKVCPGVVSCADIVAVAARDASFAVGGPSWTVKLGRRDSTTASKSLANTDLPFFTDDLQTLISKFTIKGLTAKDMDIQQCNAIVSWIALPSTFTIFNFGEQKVVKNWQLFLCVSVGLWAGLIIGFVTEYYTSNAYSPVQDVADSCRTGAATNVIFGLALGYKSVVIPIFAIAISIFVSFSFAAMYGVAVDALGMLSTIATGLAIDAYGPISDNAGGIAEMAGMSHRIRERTDALDVAGNTTAAIGKGFAIGSAALVSLALFGAFVSRAGVTTVDVLTPKVFIGLIVGAMLPYWFSAMTMKSVGSAALKMVEEVRRQFNTIPGLMEGTAKPDYATCVTISTDTSIKEMIPPGALVMLTPLIVGIFFGVETLSGVLAGSLVSGVQIAISASNTGGAWDNAKKYIEVKYYFTK
ncbi:hypothetical protein KIW84_034068 [Lathyrus oleraceus]|uniref:Plant heme peroxidase family profile domain-containing protein n=1 Tax=Pisum sativum TaxID=3888 RepID=A0A9D4Y0B2_PEA|nr:hypothetical protein KIW84_034068 [Pisum sativum]